uniref:RNA helicase n=1 Tax=Dermatophagoides pteronyssinus TaxID=6956 RepID=A0A6P6Y9M6_DERPT|nr:DEAD-box ATP-dependent RNA helicase 8-like [Dermatophagoides pteronyssinus]
MSFILQSIPSFPESLFDNENTVDLNSIPENNPKNITNENVDKNPTEEAVSEPKKNEVQEPQMPKLHPVLKRTYDVVGSRTMTFSDYFLNKDLLKGLTKMGLEYPTPVQEESLQYTLSGANLIARAKNGTGKTLAFIIPILEKISTRKKHIQALIIVPIRELAMQISNVVKTVGEFMQVNCMVCTGGTNLKEDFLRLKQDVHIVVGTLGRIDDLTFRNLLQTERNKVFHDFRSGASRCLVCTDIFMRGIDVPTVNVVVNFDLPMQSDTYLHRIGRSARFGNVGLAINFVTYDDKDRFFRIEKELGIQIESLPPKIDEALYYGYN